MNLVFDVYLDKPKRSDLSTLAALILKYCKKVLVGNYCYPTITPTIKGYIFLITVNGPRTCYTKSIFAIDKNYDEYRFYIQQAQKWVIIFRTSKNYESMYNWASEWIDNQGKRIMLDIECKEHIKVLKDKQNRKK